MELAAALASGGGIGANAEPQIVVGTIPATFGSKMSLPKEATVLGTAIQGTSALVAITMSLPADPALEAVRVILAEQGWTAPPPSPYGPSTLTEPPGAPVRDQFLLCAQHQTLEGSHRLGLSGKTTVLLRLRDAPANSVCSPPSMPSGFRPPSYPTLFNPKGTTERSGDCWQQDNPSPGGGGRALSTSMTPQELLAGLERQLQDSGWTFLGSDAIATGSWSKGPPSAQRDVELTITVPARRPECRRVDLMQYIPSFTQTMPLSNPPGPVLLPPSGASSWSGYGCKSIGGNGGGTGTRLRTPMNPDTLLAHYARQMVDSGWAPREERISVLSHTWTRADPKGGGNTDVTVMVTWSSMNPSCRAVSVNVHAPPKP